MPTVIRGMPMRAPATRYPAKPLMNMLAPPISTVIAPGMSHPFSVFGAISAAANSVLHVLVNFSSSL